VRQRAAQFIHRARLRQKARIYLRLNGEKPFISVNSRRGYSAQKLNHLCAPAFLLVHPENRFTNVPVVKAPALD